MAASKTIEKYYKIDSDIILIDRSLVIPSTIIPPTIIPPTIIPPTIIPPTIIPPTVKPKHLYYFNDFTPSEIQGDVKTWFNLESTQNQLKYITNRKGEYTDKSRMVIHYGYKYDYVNKVAKTKTTSFPLIIQQLRDRILGQVEDLPSCSSSSCLPLEFTRLLKDCTFNQCIINRYLLGQGIGAHTDREDFGGCIACYTFFGGREMEFTRKGFQPFRLYTKPGSLYVMAGESRYRWKHQMRPRLTDPVDEKHLKEIPPGESSIRLGKRIRREMSISVTFRSLKE